jgi:hypothetical protein
MRSGITKSEDWSKPMSNLPSNHFPSPKNKIKVGRKEEMEERLRKIKNKRWDSLTLNQDFSFERKHTGPVTCLDLNTGAFQENSSGEPSRSEQRLCVVYQHSIFRHNNPSFIRILVSFQADPMHPFISMIWKRM